jgi:hypothetical protein
MVTHVQRELRRLYSRYQRGELTLNDCLNNGQRVLTEAFTELKQDVQTYFSKHGLAYDSELDTGLWLVLASVLAAWQRLCNDFTPEPQQSQGQGSIALLFMMAPGRSQLTDGWDVLFVLGQPEVGFWTTSKGLRRRIDLVAQDFAYNTVNTAMLDMATTLDAKFIRWVTASDERVCEVCQTYEQGGNNGLYLVDDPDTPKPPPVHPNCRCRYEVIFV